MARRPRHWHILQGSKQEARVAVDFYNRQLGERSLEDFLIHAHLAWLYLCHAILSRSGVDIRYRITGTKRFERVDGRIKLWELAHCLRHLIPDPNSPVRRNVEFFIPLRNMVEHQYERALEYVIAGRVQSLLMNYEDLLAREFGAAEGLSSTLRFPIFLSTLTEDARAVLKRSRERLPMDVRNYLRGFDEGVPEEVLDHPSFELRILLVPKTGPRSEADVALEFVRVGDLSPEQAESLQHMQVIIREKEVPVAGMDLHKPGQAAALVESRIPWVFNTSHHTKCWKYFAVRPEATASDPTRTDQRYCLYDRPHGDHLYTAAWVEKLVRDLGEASQFEAITGIAPVARRAVRGTPAN